MSYGVRARERMPFAWDFVTLGLGGRAAAGRLDHGHLGLHVDRRARSRQSVLFSRAPVRFRRSSGCCSPGCSPACRPNCGTSTASRCCALALLLLLLVLIPGIGATVNGARRWLRIGPDEFPGVGTRQGAGADLGVQLLRAQARASSNRLCRASPNRWGCSRSRALLLLLEPDFGAATVLFATGFAVLFVAGARLRYVLLLVSAAALAFAVLALTSAYRLKRLTGFLHPWDDPFNGGFQLTQSLIAIGRGAWFGVGLGSSVQKLFYLPEAHTDFVFAVLAEELGLVGVLGVIALFMALVWRAFQISRMAAQAGMRFQSYVALAFGVWLGLQAIVNIGVNMGVLPTKGLTLPLLSYGRSSLLVSLAWLGVLLRIYHEVKCSSRSAVMRMPGGRDERGRHGRATPRSGPVLIMAGGTGGHVFPGARRGQGAARARDRRGVAGRARQHGVAAGAGERLSHRVGAGRRHSRQGPQGLAAGAAAHRQSRGRRPCGCCAACGRASVLGRGRLCERAGRHRRVAAADSAADPRTERHRRLDQSLAGALRDARCWKRFRAASGRSVHARTIGNPVRADIAALPAPAGALRRPRRRARGCWCSAAARARSA